MRGRLKPHQVLKEEAWILMFCFVIFLAFAQTTEHYLLYSCRPGYAVYVWIFFFFFGTFERRASSFGESSWERCW